MIRQRGARRLAGAWMVLLSAAALAADPPAAIPAEDFVKPETMGAIRFSPDGKHFAALAESKGRMQLVVVDAQTQKGGSYRSELDTDIATFRWLTNDVVAVTTGKRGASQDELQMQDFQSSRISLSGKTRLSVKDAYNATRPVPGSADELIVVHGRGGKGQSIWLDVVNAVDGSIVRRLTDDPPGRGIQRWVLDNDLKPRAAMGWVGGDQRRREVWYRDDVKGPWRLLTTYKPETERGFEPVAFDGQGNLMVVSNLATGRGELRRLDRTTGKPGELLVAHPLADISDTDLIYARDRLDPVGVHVEGDIPQTFWFDEKRDVIQQTIDKSLPPGLVNDLQFLPDGKVLVHSSSPADSGTYYMFDPVARTLTEWTRARSWLPSSKLGVTQVMRYKARDGLDIPAYLTLPRGREAKSLPLLVWVHGGPWARDSWTYDPVVQYFANRGYAVLQVNFRGSTGYGDEFMKAGFKQWGRTMQDDLTDGVNALIAQGRIDPQRVCIGGGSYGGYAALMGVAKEPALFKCAIDYVGVTDLAYMVDLPEADFNWVYDRNTEELLHMLVGNSDDPAERKIMDAHSPRLLAAQIKAPVLMLYGTDDVRVPLRHGTAMRDALQAAGAKYEWKTFTGEGHGVFNTKNGAELLRLMESFVNRSIGGGAGSAAK